MSKPKVAFFDFACCEGCQLQMANFGEVLLDILNLVDIVTFREVMSEKSEIYDIAIIEGSITTAHDTERIKNIRAKAKVVIAYGSCATIGGINGMKNKFDLEEIKKYVYRDGAKQIETLPTRAVHQVVKVDYFINCCPVYPPEILKVLKCVIAGIPYAVPDYAVCVECKLNENVCMYDKGITCLGPVTKAGCNSWCINNGNICYGCRGMVTNPAKNGQLDILARHKIPLDWITNKLDMYNKPRELDEQK
jgi:coenzyme F420-reducing hydrogenase gamma subunit